MKTSDNKGGSPHRAADRREAAMSGEAERKDASAGGFNKLFGDIANRTSQAAGRALTFVMAVAVVVVWAVTGPVFQYSDTWQLVINTGTTIVTFLMVFLIQNSQNRDSAAIQVKLDELIRVSTARMPWISARNGAIISTGRSICWRRRKPPAF
jgi:low affinity Fe/Cu permease